MGAGVIYLVVGSRASFRLVRPNGNYPDTGLEEISGDVLDADFELGTRRFAVIQEKGGQQLAFQMKIVSRRGVQRLGSLLDELVCHP
jgi:hypothetical protein